MDALLWTLVGLGVIEIAAAATWLTTRTNLVRTRFDTWCNLIIWTVLFTEALTQLLQR